MLIILYGPDSYRRLKKLNEIIDAYRKKQSNLSYDRFDLSNEDELFRFQDFAKNRSIFDPIRLAVLENIEECREQKELKTVLKRDLEAKDLVIVINSDKKLPTTFNLLLKAPTQVQEFPALKDAEIIAFTKNLAKTLNLTLDNLTIKTLIQTFGSNTWGIATELERMALAGNQIKSPLSIHKPADNFFQLVNTIKYGRSLKDRLVALEIILSDRQDEPARVFNILAYRLRSQKEADTFADYDVAVKSGKLEYEEVLLDYALS